MFSLWVALIGRSPLGGINWNVASCRSDGLQPHYVNIQFLRKTEVEVTANYPLCRLRRTIHSPSFTNMHQFCTIAKDDFYHILTIDINFYELV